jgi:hypothetical protein
LGTQQNVVNNSRLAMDLLIKEILNLGGTNINLIIKKKDYAKMANLSNTKKNGVK